MSWWQLIQAELRAFSQNKVVLLTVFGGVLFYSFLYPQPYLEQVPREQAITVVDLDGSSQSRALIRMANATSQLNVVRHDLSIAAAKDAFLNGDVQGILVIPQHFHRDLLLGRSPTLAYAADASYFLVYGTVIEGMLASSGTLGAQVKVGRLMVSGVPKVQAAEQYTPIRLNGKPTFNPAMGYIEYVVPAVFVMILQQTLIMGVGLVGAGQRGQGYWQKTPFWRVALLRVVLFVAIYYVLSAFYFGFTFEAYGIRRLADPAELLLLLLPFLLICCLIGLLLGALMPRRELVTVVVLLSSMPLIFSIGFIWPLQAMPLWVQQFAQLFPCTPGVQGMLELNQMGAPFHHLTAQLNMMALQLLGWGILATGALYWRAKQAD
ncbi:hypothetical protein VST7929_01122 [Vibrio stylophorae]|uniref:ABC-2 type transporter transmembrane domain-containing protein n=1 Tax=Vibrio stylophorae TaxID=659351 RepID=A0ABN8DRT2_9VIBR|nr:ABC transporter permease [Vibrio stylophorae]CAH0533258.1 hypothetical protein VST7929_01122 [Vibrio stylophorae]